MNDLNDKTLSAYSVLRDIEDKPVLLLRADMPRDVSRIGWRAISMALGGLIMAGVIVMIVMWLLLQRTMIGPLSTLTWHILSIGKSGDVSARLSLKRGDEIGILAAEFDKMLQSLAKARNRLVEHSYQAGIAEMASGVLHNVRNQLMPLVMRLGRVRERVVDWPIQKLDAALNQLTSGETPADRKDKILHYLKLSTGQMMGAQKDLGDDLDVVMHHVNLVEEVLAEQERFSRANTSLEAVQLLDVVRRAIERMPDTGVSIGVKIDPSVHEAEPVLADPFVLTHVLQNLLANAKDSMEAAGMKHGRIEISVASDTGSNGKSCTNLAVCDNGHGIEPDKLEVIFQRGFTTKKGDKRGTGLHWCSNALTGMGGRIYAESEGPHKGAALHVVLPLAEPARAAAE